MQKKEIILEGLNCANCSYKIEKKLNSLKGIKSARINFNTKKLNFLYLDDNFDFHKVKKIVNEFEPKVKLIDSKNHTDFNKFNKYKLVQIILSLLFFILGLFFNNNFEIVFFITAYLVSGHKVLFLSFNNTFKGKIFDENFLMTIATLGAVSIGEYPEAVAVMVFYLIGQFMEDIAINSSRKSISDLINIKPEYVNIFKNNKIVQVDPDTINIGEIIIVKPGEKIPLDGEIIEGESRINKSALTGESYPEKAGIGDFVLSGSINENSLIKIKVMKKFSESTAAKIMDLVENASNKKSKSEKFITKFAKYYTPGVVFSAIFISLFPTLVLGLDFSEWLYRGLLFLVISCPCALVLSIPLSSFSGIGKMSKIGILVKGANYLDILNKLENIVFDKTGTLTKGSFEVVNIEAYNNYTKDEIIEYAAYAEKYSNHPIAKSIVNKYNKEIYEEKIRSLSEVPGKGLIANIFNKTILIGNHDMMVLHKVQTNDNLKDNYGIYLAIDNILAGKIIISDEIKKNSKKTINFLKKLGIKTFLFTGDKKESALETSKELNIDKVYFELLPQDKLELFEKEFKKSKGYSAFVGDGINDSPVLARSDLGISMGGIGSDSAIESSDMVIMNDDPYKIIKGIKISKYTNKIIKQNLFFIFGIKSIFLFLGALGVASMWQAVFADVGVTVFTVINSLRILKKNF